MATYFLQDTNIHLDIKLDIDLKDNRNLSDRVLTDFLNLKLNLRKFNQVDKFLVHKSIHLGNKFREDIVSIK